MPLLALALLVLLSVAALAIDVTRARAAQLNAQKAADAASLSAASVWATESQVTPPPTVTDPAVERAQQVAGLNGLNTVFANRCGGLSAGKFDAVFYDSTADTMASCPPARWQTSVEVRIPPVTGTMPSACPSPSLNCIQVIATQNVANTLANSFGFSSTAAGSGSIAVASSGFSGSNGIPLSWGPNANGELGIGGPGDGNPHPTPTQVLSPSGVGPLTGVGSVMAGKVNSRVLMSDGTVKTWGHNNVGELGDGTNIDRSLPVAVCSAGGCGNPLRDVRQLNGGKEFGGALLSNGTLESWGADGVGEVGNCTTGMQAGGVSIPVTTGGGCGAPGFNNVTQILQSGHSGQALTANGELWTWGENYGGQMGNGIAPGPAGYTTPNQVKGPVYTGPPIISAANGDGWGILLDATGGVWTWGNNDHGERGDGTVGGPSCGGAAPQCWLTAKRVLPLPDIIAVAAEGYAAIVIDSSGHVWTWGDSYQGDLGDGGVCGGGGGGPCMSPVRIPGLPNIKAVGGGLYYGVALDAGGHVWTWGDNTAGLLGDGTPASFRASPVSVCAVGATAPCSIGAGNALSEITAISGGWDHIVALSDPPPVEGWGDNSKGQLGDGTKTQRLTAVTADPTKVPSAIQVIAGDETSYALRPDGTVWAWGANGSGLVGNPAATDPQLTPIQVVGLQNIKQITAGAVTGAALDGSGHVWTWGNNSARCTLGNGLCPGPDTSIPAQVHSTGGGGCCLGGVKAISGGGGEIEALLDDGSVVDWGSGGGGEQGNNSCPPCNDVGYPVQVHAPGGPGNLADILSINAADHDAFAISATGVMYAWGNGALGQFGTGGTPSVVPVPIPAGTGGGGMCLTGGPVPAAPILGANGDSQTVVLCSDGNIWAMGMDALGEVGNGGLCSPCPATILSPVRVDNSTGLQSNSVVGLGKTKGEHSIARDDSGHVWEWGDDSSGELGNNSVVSPRNTPVETLGPGLTPLVGTIDIAGGNLFDISISVSGSSISGPPTLVG